MHFSARVSQSAIGLLGSILLSAKRQSRNAATQVLSMTHEEFEKLAKATCRNAGGLVTLIDHVLRLYPALRKLQIEDNSFYYMAEVIKKARGDKTELENFKDRIKTYYHRLRREKGDPLIKRGTELSATRQIGEDAARPFDHQSDNVSGAVALSASPAPEPSGSKEPNIANAHASLEQGQPNTLALVKQPPDPPRQMSLTEALHSRTGRRRLAEE
ncbi:hypothetical protein [Devosia sp. Leaf64]|uniref:hypothetical protein n=1 Tax=Devosia sp. Leaf64 TaxID=1736229 RepID=UPI0007160521|nr:hypothetical protein [Devosia sp. Leaf64]KQN73479.1 hypothetical protein ASE94_06500 [Devosia sp. Leaf64]